MFAPCLLCQPMFLKFAYFVHTLGLTGGQLLKKKQEDRINAEQQNRQAHRAVPEVVDSGNEPVLPDVTPT